MFDTPGELKGVRGWLQAQEWLRAKAEHSFQYSASELLLTHGHEWTFTGKRLPKGIRPGVKRECYRNATMLALTEDHLTYCEGLALNYLFPVEHAWCVDRQGNVIDNTWSRLRLPKNRLKLDKPEYFGVAIKTSFLRKTLSKMRFYGLIYQPPRHPLFKLPVEKWLADIKPLQ